MARIAIVVLGSSRRDRTGLYSISHACRRHADVIVLGEHCHGFVARLFGADVEGEVQREAGCDVILA